MVEDVWSSVDDYFGRSLLGRDPVLDNTLGK